jgi:hypothetical protein
MVRQARLRAGRRIVSNDYTSLDEFLSCDVSVGQMQQTLRGSGHAINEQVLSRHVQWFWVI